MYISSFLVLLVICWLYIECSQKNSKLTKKEQNERAFREKEEIKTFFYVIVLLVYLICGICILLIIPLLCIALFTNSLPVEIIFALVGIICLYAIIHILYTEYELFNLKKQYVNRLHTKKYKQQRENIKHKSILYGEGE